jgi:hypothetical protein
MLGFGDVDIHSFGQFSMNILQVEQNGSCGAAHSANSDGLTFMPRGSMMEARPGEEDGLSSIAIIPEPKINL